MSRCRKIEAVAANTGTEEQTGAEGSRMEKEEEEEQQRGEVGLVEKEETHPVRERTMAEKLQHRWQLATIQDKRQRVQEENKRLRLKLAEVENLITKEDICKNMALKQDSMQDQVLQAEKRFQFYRKANYERNAVRHQLKEKIEASKSEIVELQSHVMENKSYWDIALRVLGSEGQEVHDGGTQEEGNDQESRGSKGGSEEDFELLPSISETTPSSSSTSDAANSDLHTVKEDEEHLVLPEPQEFVALLQGLEHQILSLMQNPTTVNQDLVHAMETKKRGIKEEQERFSLQINDKKYKIIAEKSRLVIARRWVELHKLTQTEDEDCWLEVVDKKVAEVYAAIVNPAPNKFSTLKKLTEMEDWMVKLLREMEDFPAEELKMSLERLREDRRRKEEERKKLETKEKMMKKCKERAYGVPRTNVGKRLMPRSILVKPEGKVSEEVCVPEEDPAAFLFSEDSD